MSITAAPSHLLVDATGRRVASPGLLDSPVWDEWAVPLATPLGWPVGDRWALQRWGTETQRPWELARFHEAHCPCPGPTAAFDWDTPLPSVLDMVVRAPHGPCRLPQALRPLRPFIDQVLAAARWASPDWDARWLYLTVDQRHVVAGTTHRLGGWHVDGLVGPRHAGRRFPVCAQFLASSHAPTPYAVQPFDVTAVDLGTTNLFACLGTQVRLATVMTPPARHLIVMHGQHVHASPVVHESGLRTLIRLEGSHKHFDRLGNTQWPGFAAETAGWAWQRRPIPVDLRAVA